MEKYQTRAVIIRLCIAVIVIITAVWGLLVWNNIHISKIDTTNYSVYETGTDGYEMLLDAAVKRDAISITKDYITISGWVANTNEDMSRVTIDVVLVDADTDEAYVVPTTMSERTDVTEHYGTHNLNWSGFSVKIPFGNKIDTEKHNYKIMALLKVNDHDAVIVNSGKQTEDFKNNEE